MWYQTKTESANYEERIYQVEQAIKDVYELINVLNRRLDYCETFSQPVDYLLQQAGSAPAVTKKH